MSMLRVYLYGMGQKVIIPKMVITEEGFYTETAPIKIFQLHELGQWKQYAVNCLEAGNDVVATPDQYEQPGSALLEELGLKRWQDFETNAVMYTVHVRPSYITIFSTGKDKTRMWTRTGKKRTFASQAPLGMVVDELAEEMMREPEAVPQPTTLLLSG